MRRYVCSVFALIALAIIPAVSPARIADMGGGYVCNIATTTSGDTTWEFWDCFYMGDGGGGGGGGSPPEPPPGGGGGGGLPPPDTTDRDISTKLKCAMDNYSHSKVKLTGGKGMKKVNAWAFGKKNAQGAWGYDIRGANISPGADWLPIGGITATQGFSYGRMYNVAFQANSSFSANGSRPGAPSNSIRGSMSAFEMSIFIGVHEASHLLGNRDEKEADWYGIDAVLKYRRDGGRLCADQPN